MRLLSNMFAVDSRSLALLRAGLGCTALIDFALRLTHVTAQYTDAGMVPRQAIAGMIHKGWPLSVSLLSGGTPLQILLLLLGCTSAAALALGWRTRTMTVLTWLLVVSFQVRNPYVLHGGDTLLRLLLLWSAFLPLGYSWSLDARDARRTNHAMFNSSMTAILMLQMVVMFLLSGLWKSGPAWTQDFTAVELSLKYAPVATPFASSVASMQWLTTVATPLIRYGEIAIAIAILIPWKRHALRLAAVVAAIVMHALFGICFTLDTFILVAISGWIGLLPTSAWQAMGGSEAKPERDDIPLPARAFAIGAFALAVTFCVAYYAGNVEALRKQTGRPRFEERGTPLPRPLLHAAFALRVDQHWTMFAPHPPAYDRWYDVRTEDGRDVLWPEGATTPPYPFSRYVSDRLRNYLTREPEELATLFPHLGAYLCRTHDLEGTLTLRTHARRILVGKQQEPWQTKKIATHTCH